MSGQIIFFKKNKADYQNSNCVVTASESSNYAPYVQRRRNDIGFMTTGSSDASNTTITVDFVDLQTLTDIILVKHNFKSFTIKYWDGASYVDFSTPIVETANISVTSRYSFNSIAVTKFQITVTGTMVLDAEKKIAQIIATELIGQLSAWPIIKTPVFFKNRQNIKALSGKTVTSANSGGFQCALQVKVLSADADLTIIERLYGSGTGFLVWLSGGVASQFSSSREGYRLEDIYLMRSVNDYSPEWNGGLYKSGMVLGISLAEVVF